MSLSAWSVTAVVAAEENAEPLLHPYAVGGIALGLLLAALLALLAFGGGRDHT